MVYLISYLLVPVIFTVFILRLMGYKRYDTLKFIGLSCFFLGPFAYALTGIMMYMILLWAVFYYISTRKRNFDFKDEDFSGWIR